MCFDIMWESAQQNELLLIEGGYCLYHLRQDGQVTIREIIATKPGAGSVMLEQLKQVPGARWLYAKCPATLRANDWYRKKGFILDGHEVTKKNQRVLNLWRFPLPLNNESSVNTPTP